MLLSERKIRKVIRSLLLEAAQFKLKAMHDLGDGIHKKPRVIEILENKILPAIQRPGYLRLMRLARRNIPLLPYAPYQYTEKNMWENNSPNRIDRLVIRAIELAKEDSEELYDLVKDIVAGHKSLVTAKNMEGKGARYVSRKDPELANYFAYLESHIKAIDKRLAEEAEAEEAEAEEAEETPEAETGDQAASAKKKSDTPEEKTAEEPAADKPKEQKPAAKKKGKKRAKVYPKVKDIQKWIGAPSGKDKDGKAQRGDGRWGKNTTFAWEKWLMLDTTIDKLAELEVAEGALEEGRELNIIEKFLLEEVDKVKLKVKLEKIKGDAAEVASLFGKTANLAGVHDLVKTVSVEAGDVDESRLGGNLPDIEAGWNILQDAAAGNMSADLVPSEGAGGISTLNGSEGGGDHRVALKILEGGGSTGSSEPLHEILGRILQAEGDWEGAYEGDEAAFKSDGERAFNSTKLINTYFEVSQISALLSKTEKGKKLKTAIPALLNALADQFDLVDQLTTAPSDTEPQTSETPPAETPPAETPPEAEPEVSETTPLSDKIIVLGGQKLYLPEDNAKVNMNQRLYGDGEYTHKRATSQMAPHYWIIPAGGTSREKPGNKIFSTAKQAEYIKITKAYWAAQK